MSGIREPQRLKAMCTVDADKYLKLEELFHSRNLLAVEGLKAKQATNGFGMAINWFDVELNLLEIIQLEKPEIKKDKDMNLENTKVYTDDAEVIRKYAELCGVDHITSGKSLKLGQKATGAAYTNDKVVAFGYSFIPSYVDFDEIPVGLINYLYAEKFSETETPEEAEAFNIMAQDNEQLQNHEVGERVEWKNGDECIYMSHNVVQQFIGADPRREGYGYIQAPTYEVNFVELSKLSKPETPQQREERERLEAAYDLYHDYYLQTGIKEPNWATAKQSIKDHYLHIVDKTGYRKQKDGD